MNKNKKKFILTSDEAEKLHKKIWAAMSPQERKKKTGDIMKFLRKLNRMRD